MRCPICGFEPCANMSQCPRLIQATLDCEASENVSSEERDNLIKVNEERIKNWYKYASKNIVNEWGDPK